MTVEKWSQEARIKLAECSLTPSLDAEILLAHFMKKDRAWVLAHAEDNLDEKTCLTLSKALVRRTSGEPIAYITGQIEFYGRVFYVDSRVLVPRPESEDFIEIMRALIDKTTENTSIIDMGTGSGVLAITLKLEYPNLDVTATDISKQALKVARMNANRYKLSIPLRHQDLLSDTDAQDIVVANLPYVPINMRDPSIQMEPDEALYSGIDGLDHYRRLFQQLQKKTVRYVLTESLLDQHEQLNAVAKLAGFVEHSKKGLVQVFTLR